MNLQPSSAPKPKRPIAVFCPRLVVRFAWLALPLLWTGCPKKPAPLNALFMKQAGYSEEDIQAGTIEFEKQHPGVKVALTFVAYEELEKKIITSAQAGSYDVVLSDAPFTAKFAQAKFLRETPMPPDSDREDIFQGAMASCLYKGKAYGMPWLNDCKYLFYNKRMLQIAGFTQPPKTWEELVHQARVLKEKKIVSCPLVWSWMQAECLTCDFTLLTAAFGGRLFDQEGHPTLTATGNRAALNFMSNSLKEGISNPKSIEFKEDDVMSAFCNGDAAFCINWTYMYEGARDLAKSKVAAEVGIALVPGSAGVRSATVNGGQPLAISTGSRQADLAWKYIQHLTSREFQKKHPKNALPIWQSLYKHPEVRQVSPELVSIAQEQYQHLVNRPQVPYYSELSTELQVKIQETLLGKRSSDDALEAVQATALALAKKQ